MNSFRFRLQKVLELREAELSAEEAKLKQETAALSELDRLKGALEAAATNAEMQVRRGEAVTGSDLEALGAYRLVVRSQQAELARKRVAQAARVSDQNQAMLEARRRCRLLERLKERRLSEWREAAAKEMEELASESYIAQWNSRQRQSEAE